MDNDDVIIVLTKENKTMKKLSVANCWISHAVTFYSTFSLHKYIQGKFGLPESAPDRQVFKN